LEVHDEEIAATCYVLILNLLCMQAVECW
jgi:hypothetical protein